MRSNPALSFYIVRDQNSRCYQTQKKKVECYVSALLVHARLSPSERSGVCVVFHAFVNSSSSKNGCCFRRCFKLARYTATRYYSFPAPRYMHTREAIRVEIRLTFCVARKTPSFVIVADSRKALKRREWGRECLLQRCRERSLRFKVGALTKFSQIAK